MFSFPKEVRIIGLLIDNSVMANTWIVNKRFMLHRVYKLDSFITVTPLMYKLKHEYETLFHRAHLASWSIYLIEQVNTVKLTFFRFE